MPKPIINNPLKNQEAQRNILSASVSYEKLGENKTKDKIMIDRLLRKPRSKKYMEVMKKLDSGGHVMNKQAVDALINAIRDEFQEIEMETLLLGIVSLCYLGELYEVHVLDITGGIIEHYQRGKNLPEGMEKARSIAMHGGYEFIEVYTDCCRAVSSNGVISVIN